MEVAAAVHPDRPAAEITGDGGNGTGLPRRHGDTETPLTPCLRGKVCPVTSMPETDLSALSARLADLEAQVQDLTAGTRPAAAPAGYDAPARRAARVLRRGRVERAVALSAPRRARRQRARAQTPRADVRRVQGAAGRDLPRPSKRPPVHAAADRHAESGAARLSGAARVHDRPWLARMGLAGLKSRFGQKSP